MKHNQTDQGNSMRHQWKTHELSMQINEQLNETNMKHLYKSMEDENQWTINESSVSKTKRCATNEQSMQGQWNINRWSMTHQWHIEISMNRQWYINENQWIQKGNQRWTSMKSQWPISQKSKLSNERIKTPIDESKERAMKHHETLRTRQWNINETSMEHYQAN